MDIVDLPSIAGHMPIVDALQELKLRARSGVLVDLGNLEPRVITAGEIKTVLHRRLRLQQSVRVPVEIVIPQRRSLVVRPRITFAEFRAQRAARDRIQAMLTAGNAAYAIVGMEYGMAEVVTASEAFAASLRAALTLCECRRYPGEHVLAPEDIITPGICNFCGSQVDCS